MMLKYLKSRWFENQDTCSALAKIKQISEDGGTLKKEYSPFGVIDNNLADFRGLDLSKQQIKKLKIENADLSYSNFQSSWIEKSVFSNVKIEKVDLSEISDRGNLFKEAFIMSCNFNKAVLGYGGSQYLDCIIDSSSFVRTGFIRGEYNSCHFINCKLKGADFSASSFENCSFDGKLTDVWFRGGYGYPNDENEFGKAKKNQMKNVSFEKAILEGVNFSNECDLSSIKLPKTGNYQLFYNWAGKLERLKTIISDWPASQKNEAEIFVNSYLVHAKTQDWFLINIEEIQRDFGVDVAGNIIIALNEK